MESLLLSGAAGNRGQMADVSLRHRNASPSPVAPVRRGASLNRPLVLSIAAVLLVIAVGGLIGTAIEVYRDAMLATGLTMDTTPVKLAIGPDELVIPANMIRSGKVRRGGPVDHADLVLSWPALQGYSASLAGAFADGGPSAPVIYATIAARDEAMDSTDRLDEVYSRFFTGTPLAGPDGLVGRKLSADSGYDGEIVYFIPSAPRPFVARCLADSTPEVPSICLRDVNFGRGLSLLYRFNRDMLADWRALDAGMQKLAASFLAE